MRINSFRALVLQELRRLRQPVRRLNLPILGSTLCLLLSTQARGKDLELGLIGLDTSHVIAFTQLLNNPAAKGHVPGARVVVAFRGGSPDIPSSADRLEQYTTELQQRFGVRLVDSVEALAAQVDGVLLESVDGRKHLEQARPVIAARKPLFIDKPLAGSLRDAVVICQLAESNKVPCFSSSSYRFYPSLVAVKNKDVGQVQSVISYGPCSLEPHHPDLFWYGVHTVEALYTILGPGCQTVTRTTSPQTDVVTGLWTGGKVGTFYGLRGAKTPHQVLVFGSKDVAVQEGSGDYSPLVAEIVRFFQTGRSPVSLAETLEMFAFMEAADESKRQNGAPVRLDEVLRKAGFQK